MTVTETTTTETTIGDDALQRVHHHCEPEDLERSKVGEAVWSLCGILKRRTPNAQSLPCCPLCADIIHDRGGRCAVRPGASQ